MASRTLLVALYSLCFLCVPPALAGTYKAQCDAKSTCVVKITTDRLIVGDRVVPIQAIFSWVKGGPGLNTNSGLGAGATILLGVPGMLLYGVQSFKSVFDIAYFTPSGEIGHLYFGFNNVDESRFFETEILATLAQPMGKESPQAKSFVWKESDYSLQPDANPVKAPLTSPVSKPVP
jgi:hypothetical protein